MNDDTSSWSGQRRSIPRRIAKRILFRDTECQLAYHVCEGPATEVDHIVGHADALALGWPPDDIDDETNLRGVCRPCHRLRTREQQQRGRARAAARRPSAKRAARPHPGLKQQP